MVARKRAKLNRHVHMTGNGGRLQLIPKELRINYFVTLMRRRLTSGQLASVLEEWELVCQANSWPVPPRRRGKRARRLIH